MADDQPDYSGSCMIALYPPPEVARSLAVPDGLSAKGMHVTIAYTGAAADVDPEALNKVAKSLAGRPEISAMISGHARFTGGEQDVIVALVDSPALETLRADAREALAAAGIPIPSEHGFTPHMSIRYCGQDEDDPVGRLAALPVTFSAVSAVHAKARTDYPFGDPLPAQAREAYAAGWALSGGPMTGRVKAGCDAAVTVALENRGDPRVLEATLDLGHLAGTWATVYDRRERLQARHVKDITAAWRELVKRLDVRELPALYRRELVLGESADPKPAKRQRRAAAAAVLLWLQQILSDPGYADLAAVIGDAMEEAAAEGRTSALAVAADQAGARGFDWAKAFDAMRAAIAPEDTQGAAAQVTQAIIRAVTADTGRLVAKAVAAGASDAEIEKTVKDSVEAEDAEAPALAVDTAGSGFMCGGALGIYSAEGIEVDWLTAGDGRVCFPAGTPVMTPGGERPIEDLRAGDLVLTPEGELPVRRSGSRPYGGGLTVLTTEGGTVAATDDHPFWTPGGWREIGQLQPGDLVHTSEDESAEVRSVVHLVFAEPDRAPADASKLRVTQGIVVAGDAVPVCPVSLDGDTVPDNGEVDGPLAEGVFLLEVDPEAFQGDPDASLKPGFAVEAAVAGDGAELRVRLAGHAPESLAAIPAREDHGRSPAFLGTVMPVEVLLGPKSLPAALAIDVDSVGGLAGDGTDVVPVSDGHVDREIIPAHRAVLHDLDGCAASVVALPAAERSAGRPSGLQPEGLAARGALPFGMADGRGVVALTGAEGPLQGDSRVTHELLAAVSAFIAERHSGQHSTLYVTGIDSIPVYDIEVEQEHVFFASGFLVHNCSSPCDENEENGPYLPEDFPDFPGHPRCRCTPAPASPVRFTAFAPFLARAA